MCAYSFCPVEQFIIEHVISMCPALKTGRGCMLLSVKGKLDIRTSNEKILTVSPLNIVVSD